LSAPCQQSDDTSRPGGCHAKRAGLHAGPNTTKIAFFCRDAAPPAVTATYYIHELRD
jgi:hypothetical protein